jgi:hypothetical protein
MGNASLESAAAARVSVVKSMRENDIMCVARSLSAASVFRPTTPPALSPAAVELLGAAPRPLM